MAEGEEKEEQEEKKRIRPVVEEVVEEPKETPVQPAFLKVAQKEHKEKHEASGSVEKPIDKKREGHFKIIFATALITAIVTMLLSGGVYVYFSGVGVIPGLGGKGEVKDIIVRVTPAPDTSTPSPTSTPQSDVSIYSASVLNGSGAKGAASTASALLAEEGFKVDNAGNAKTFDFTKTLVQVKEGVPAEVVEKATAALSSSYLVEQGEPLPAASQYDIVITVGAAK